ncbi:hypothetical protein [Sulfurimonas sp.]|uniref:hypothetical protein n=1 Tax=Sulfurimonas sp. TaxID=2022749 RepID=UPI0025EA5617|nr:hypothetical protein [Sulfurimonas sp.]
MNVSQYTFQSPYSSAFQVGRLDPNSRSGDTGSQPSSDFVKNTNSTLANAQSFKASQTSEVKPTVDSAHVLDIYA